MAKRTSKKKLTVSELIVRKLKKAFDRRGDSAASGNVWVMTIAAVPFRESSQNSHKPGGGDPKPSHHVRIVLRTSEPDEGGNPYVDGSDFFLVVDEQQQTAEFVWEEDSFADAPLLHGSEILTAIQWTAELTESLLCVRLADPFSNEASKQRAESETKSWLKNGDEAWM